jgi:predicted GNAT family acetyltransferase
MKLIRYSCADELLEKAGAWLQQSEAENNVILGVANRFRQQQDKEGSNTYWAAITENDEVAGCAFRTPPMPISMTSMPAAAIPLLVEDLSESHSNTPGLHGPADVVEEFARLWSERHSLTWHAHMRLKIHRLEKVVFPTNAAPGELRRVSEADAPLIRDWVAKFIVDADAVDDPDESAERVLASENARIWDHDGPRSMVVGMREMPRGMSLSGVYTPPEYRGRGYASMVVAAYSQEVLDSGKEYCCLYTDGDNPTSNSIYARIGYVPIRDDLHISFVRRQEENE